MIVLEPPKTARVVEQDIGIEDEVLSSWSGRVKAVLPGLLLGQNPLHTPSRLPRRGNDLTPYIIVLVNHVEVQWIKMTQTSCRHSGLPQNLSYENIPLVPVFARSLINTP